MDRLVVPLNILQHAACVMLCKATNIPYEPRPILLSLGVRAPTVSLWIWDSEANSTLGEILHLLGLKPKRRELQIQFSKLGKVMKSASIQIRSWQFQSGDDT